MRAAISVFVKASRVLVGFCVFLEGVCVKLCVVRSVEVGFDVGERFWNGWEVRFKGPWSEGVLEVFEKFRF